MSDQTELLDTIRQIKGVQDATLWTRVPGKERIYVDLEKHNGGRNWNGGVGHVVVVELTDLSARYDRNCKWAGSTTRKIHERNDTLGQIQEALNA